MFNWDDFIEGKVGVSFEEKSELSSFLKMIEERGLGLAAVHDAYINAIFHYGSKYILHDPIDMKCYTAISKNMFEYILTYKEAFNELFNTNYPSKTELMEFLKA